MKKLFVLVIIFSLPVLCFSQASGGQVIRKPNINNNLRHSKPSSTLPTLNGINRNFDGIILGKSTMQDVINHLKKNKNRFKTKTTGNITEIEICNDIYWGGITWFNSIYYFYKNVMYRYVNIKYARPDTDIEIIDSEHSLLLKVLSRKYKDYTIDNGKRRQMDCCSIMDGKTTIQIEKGYEGSTYLMSIEYWDFDLTVKEINESNDDL